MNRCYYLLLVLILPIVGIAQVAQEEIKRNLFMNPLSDLQQNHIRTMNFMDNKNNLSDYFIYLDWTPMVVEGLQNNIMKVDSANFLIAENKILFIKDGEMFQVFPHTAKKVTVGDKLFKPFQSVKSGQGDILEMYEVIVPGEMELVKSWYIEEKNLTSNPMGVPDNNKITIVQKSKLYYGDARSQLEEIPRKKSDLIKIFGRKKNKIVTYASKNKLSLKKENDLQSIFLYYNTLINESN